MHSTGRRRLARGSGVPTENKSTPGPARFAISAMNGKFTISELQQVESFMDGLVVLVRHDPICALEKLLSTSGSKVLQTALTVEMDGSFWHQFVLPLLESLSMDELQIGCRKQLTTNVFQNMIRIPFFLQVFSVHLDDGVVDPILALSIVDRVGTNDSSLKEDDKFMEVVQVLSTKLNGQLRAHLLAKFKSKNDASAILQDTTLNTLRELKFDRHDNDFENIADIELLPTKQELECLRPPHLPLASGPMETAVALFDTHFRWLREDLVGPMRETIALLRSESEEQKDKNNVRLLKRLQALTFRPVQFENLKFVRHFGIGIVVSFPHPVPFKQTLEHQQSETKRTAILENHYKRYWMEKPNILRRGAVVVFARESSGDFVRFGEILDGNHPKHPLLTDPQDGMSRITVRFGSTQFPGAFSDMIAQREGLSMTQIDVSFFAYKPILRRLQQMHAVDLVSKLLPGQISSLTGQCSGKDEILINQPQGLSNALRILKDMEESTSTIGKVLPACHKTMGSFALDKQQCMAVELALSNQVSLIQGPPGTGKSLCGAVIGALLHQSTKLRILCLCYTNHALDAFLEDLIKVGVPHQHILRIGSGCRADPNSSVAKTRLEAVKSEFCCPVNRPLRRLLFNTYACLNVLEEKATKLKDLAGQMAEKKWGAVKEYLREYSSTGGGLVEAFLLHPTTDGYTVAGLRENKLWERWVAGSDPPNFVPASVRQHRLWTLPASRRDDLVMQWIKDILSEVESIAKQYDDMTTRIQQLRDEASSLIMQSRRIIGCTTTGASSFSHLLDGSAVDVLIMEEAGEILEAHSIAAIGKQVQRLVLIGDHLQLRPKIENYSLGVDASQGRYALDVSLFERLIQSGVPHVTLEQQHRMCPSVAAFVTELTYPSLRTAPTVQRRSLIGAPHNVIFISHSELEDCAGSLRGESSLSKTNKHEVDWVVAIAQFLLCQPEYGADDIVILTPYLGQVLLLRKALTRLCKKTAVALNERDVSDLIKAGVDVDVSESDSDADKSGKSKPKDQLEGESTPVSGMSKVKRKEIKVATVDNFQGEEGNIIISSLVRSNDDGDIGFVSQPQRINVLLSRAREAMIFVGNASTLTSSRKGGKVWEHIIELFRQQGTVEQGITVSCQTHGTNQLLHSPPDFFKKAPDGGCSLSCDNTLKCGHYCPRSCHRGPCTRTCPQCAEQKRLQREQEGMARKQKEWLADYKVDREKRELKLDKRRLELLQQQDKLAQIVDVERIKLEEDLLKKESELIEKASTEKVKKKIKLLRKRHEEEMKQLEARFADPSSASSEGSLKSPKARMASSVIGQDVAEKCNSTPTDVPAVADLPIIQGSAKDNDKAPSRKHNDPFTTEDEWQDLRVKVSSDQRISMDGLMGLVGLSRVKKIALEIFKKQKADQQLKMDGLSDAVVKQTLNFCFVGNPGTGKTTVAKFFAGVLAELGARVGRRFENVTASELLRLGEENFATRISSMCGSEEEKAPPLGKILRKNLKVEVHSTDLK